ncbi:MAG: stage II sporulation protein M [Nitrospirae bacterium]|nr:stage II sporulation protein M [Nitrospirota bacterium]
MKNYSHELSGFLQESTKYIFFAVMFFSIGIFIGYLYPYLFKGMLDSFGRMAKRLLQQNMYGLILSIFIRNSLSAFIAVMFGELLAIIPIIAALINGILLGTTISYVNQTMVILGLLPHGIFELPAVFIAWGLGIRRGVWYFQKGPSNYSFKELRNMSLRIYFNIIMPLLLIAAIIEGLGITADSMF